MAEGQNIKDSHQAPGEHAAKKETSILPSSLRGEHIKKAEDDFYALMNQINTETPSDMYDGDDVIGVLRTVNPPLAMFLEQKANMASTVKDKLLVAGTAKIVYHAMRMALDPERKFEDDSE